MGEPRKTKRISRKNHKKVRLFVKAKFVGFKRSKVQQNTNQSILNLEGVNDRSAARYYFGKRVVYVYKTTSGQKDKRFKTIWGRVSKCHGNNGSLIASFKKNLPPRAMGSTLRVMLFPQRG